MIIQDKRYTEFYKDIISLVDFISAEHQRFSQKFELTHNLINLGRKRLDDVLSASRRDEAFINLVKDYVHQVGEWGYSVSIPLVSSALSVRFRGKSIESTLNKLHYYMVEKEHGIALNKIINDLMGFRIIVDVDINYDSIRKVLEEERKSIIFRPYVRRDEGYHALHLYFKNNNNRYFPWEL